MSRPLDWAAASHSSMLLRAVDNECEVESDKLWITGTGRFFPVAWETRRRNVSWAFLEAGEPVMDTKPWETPLGYEAG